MFLPNKAQKLANDKELMGCIEEVLHSLVPELAVAKKLGKDLLSVKLSAKQINTITKTMSHDHLDFIKRHKMANLGDQTKTPKEILFNFFGMNENWNLGRNLIGGFMVHSPEYPTYFIPAYTQAKATGDASDLKKGEGPRGLITGGLEGIAVGALVSGEMLKPKEMIPYIVLGMGLQLFSCKVFPWLGEKMGKFVHEKTKFKNLIGNAQGIDELGKNINSNLKSLKTETSNEVKTATKLDVKSVLKQDARPDVKQDAIAQVEKSQPKLAAFQGRNLYNVNNSTGLRI